jgi:hypothetical protein
MCESFWAWEDVTESCISGLAGRLLTRHLLAQVNLQRLANHIAASHVNVRHKPKMLSAFEQTCVRWDTRHIPVPNAHLCTS